MNFLEMTHTNIFDVEIMDEMDIINARIADPFLEKKKSTWYKVKLVTSRRSSPKTHQRTKKQEKIHNKKTEPKKLKLLPKGPG